jgi:hypothetical protein
MCRPVGGGTDLQIRLLAERDCGPQDRAHNDEALTVLETLSPQAPRLTPLGGAFIA